MTLKVILPNLYFTSALVCLGKIRLPLQHTYNVTPKISISLVLHNLGFENSLSKNLIILNTCDQKKCVACISCIKYTYLSFFVTFFLTKVMS